jgi:putative ABC transport system permease protein
MFVLYVRAALANLRLRKATALINICGLTLGITCFVIAFAVADYFQHVNREFANAGRIYVLEQRNLAPGDDTAAPFSPSASLSLAKYLAVEAPEVEAVARKTQRFFVQVDVGDQRFRQSVMFTDPALLRIFDYRFVDGDPSEALAGTNSAVITEPIAEQLFGTRSAVGKTFTINRRVDVVVGGVVAVPDPLSSGRTEILLSYALRDALAGAAPPADRDDWTQQGLSSSAATFVLLPANGSFGAAELERRLQAVARRIALPDGESVSFRVRPLEDHIGDTLTAGFAKLGVAPGVPAVRLFFLPGLLVLAMACFNYVNLATALAASRAKDVGLSRVLGAERRHVIARYLFEAIVAVLIGVVLALLFAALAMISIRSLTDLRIDWSNLATPSFALLLLALVAATSLAAGAFPAYVMSRFRPIEALRKGSKRSGTGWAKSVFIGVQFAVASVLLTAVSVMFAQNSAMRAAVTAAGIAPLVQLPTNLAAAGVDPAILAAELERAPQVTGVTGMRTVAWASPSDPPRYARSTSDADLPIDLQAQFISYDFFATLGAELVAGREFARGRDIEETAATDGLARQAGARAIVLDREAVRLLGWSTPQQAIGQSVYQRTETSRLAAANATAFEIVGVVDHAPLTLLSFGAKGHAYHLDPHDTLPIVRLAGADVQGGLAHIQKVWQSLTGSAVGELRPVFLDDLRDQSLRTMNGITAALLTVVAFGFSVALAGIFGMALFVANRRRHEIGIRKCLGASSRKILRQLLVEFGRPVVLGNVMAWPVGYLLADIYVQWFVARMSFTPWPYLASLVVALGLAWLAVGGQALKAARLIPARVLRDE